MEKSKKPKHEKDKKPTPSKTSDASKVDQKQGTAIGQNPDHPDRMVT